MRVFWLGPNHDPDFETPPFEELSFIPRIGDEIEIDQTGQNWRVTRIVWTVTEGHDRTQEPKLVIGVE
jgi:hypothetical protein